MRSSVMMMAVALAAMSGGDASLAETGDMSIIPDRHRSFSPGPQPTRGSEPLIKTVARSKKNARRKKRR